MVENYYINVLITQMQVKIYFKSNGSGSVIKTLKINRPEDVNLGSPLWLIVTTNQTTQPDIKMVFYAVSTIDCVEIIN